MTFKRSCQNQGPAAVAAADALDSAPVRLLRSPLSRCRKRMRSDASFACAAALHAYQVLTVRACWWQVLQAGRTTTDVSSVHRQKPPVEFSETPISFRATYRRMVRCRGRRLSPTVLLTACHRRRSMSDRDRRSPSAAEPFKVRRDDGT